MILDVFRRLPFCKAYIHLVTSRQIIEVSIALADAIEELLSGLNIYHVLIDSTDHAWVVS